MINILFFILDDSMDLDPNYDPSEFLNLRNTDVYATKAEGQSEINVPFDDNMEECMENQSNTIHDSLVVPQMPLLMPNSGEVGIDDDLAISESEDEDQADNVAIKTERNDLQDDLSYSQMASSSKDYLMQVTKEENLSQNDDNDDGWLHF